MCGRDQLLQPPTPRSGRRRSADIGGLSLATRNGGVHGQGWLGHKEQLQTRYAELLSDMYTQTLQAVNNHTADCSSPRLAPDTRPQLIAALDAWNFEPQTLPSEDHVVECAILIFEALFRIEGMQETIGVSLEQIPPFIQHLRHIYRWQNSYHNFEHALDVLQAAYSYLRAAEMVPPVSILLARTPETWRSPRAFDSGPLVTILGPTDLFVLMVAAIGHDAGHPGFTNLFMQNAAAPLSAVYDGKSPLEQLHVALLVRVMRAHGMARVLDTAVNESDDSGPGVGLGDGDGEHTGRGRTTRARKLLFDTVLATDMRVHDAFMERFADLVAGRGDLSLAHRRTTLCQALIKCADISNPSRPYYISQHWAVALQREWNAQAVLEAHHDLPCTVEASAHPLRTAASQMFFIPKFVKPLLDAVVQAVPELQSHVDQCDLNLSLWTARLDILKTTEAKASAAEAKPKPKPTAPAGGKKIRRRGAVLKEQKKEPTCPPPPPPPPVPPRQPEDYNSAFPLTLPPAHARTPPIRGSVDPNYSWNSPPPPSSRASAASPPPPASSASVRPTSCSTSASPSEEDADSEASFAFSPASRGTSTTSASPAPLSAGGSASGGGSDEDSSSDRTVVLPLDDGTAAIRAAAQRAGMPMRTCGRNFHLHRNSWSPQMMQEEWGSKLRAAGVS